MKPKSQFFPQISIVMPCLNEANSLNTMLNKIHQQLYKWKEIDISQVECIVIDNGSRDNSVHIAKKWGSTVFIEANKGYGNALRLGFKKAKGELIIMIDSDNTYEISAIPTIVHAYKNGQDLILASRIIGSIDSGAMPLLHRYMGNPFLTKLINFLFGCHISDSQTGMRGMRRSILEKCNLSSSGFELASEIIIEMTIQKSHIYEFPTHYKRRITKSKLRPFRDGLRHIRLIISKFLLYKCVQSTP